MSGSTITFTSDFGTREYYVGAVKGVLLETNPEARVIDISHDIPSHDILAGAFTLAGCYSFFPSGTVHLVVVDPGVGSTRRALVATSERYQFVAPDNGVLSLVCLREPVTRVVSVEADHYFRQPVCPTFHGRDVFAPVAGSLAKGIDPGKFGPEVDDFRRLGLPPPTELEDGGLEGFVLHIDKFGNVITSLTPDDFARRGVDLSSVRLVCGDHTVSRFAHYYAEGEGEELFFLLGSAGHLEIAALKRPASRILAVRRGAKVRALPR